MRALLALAAVAAFSFCATAEELTADTSLAEDSRMMRSVNLEDLKAIIVSEGHTLDSVGTFGDVSARGSSSDGLIFHLIGTACETQYSDDCLGFMIQIRYDSDESVTTDAINDANLNYAAVSTWWDRESKTVGVTRYVILDGGQTMENLKINLQNALALGPLVADVVWPSDDVWDDEYWDDLEQ